jgi:hypothetical protein
METVNLNLTLHDINEEYVFKLAETVLLNLPKNTISEEILNKIYDGMVKSFGLGIHLEQDATKNGSTGFSIK